MSPPAVSAFAFRHAEVRVSTTSPTAFIDLTDRLNDLISGAHLSIGTLVIQSAHTTTGLVVNEREPLLLADFEAMLERLAPRSLAYWHDEMALRGGVPRDEPCNGHAHCRALVLPMSAALIVRDGRLLLGRWQRVFLVELDGPRERTLSLLMSGEVRR
jgi:secondary thiamine-phosphate synthase enzyme